MQKVNFERDIENMLLLYSSNSELHIEYNY
jgi:hypothetical protein